MKSPLPTSKFAFSLFIFIWGSSQVLAAETEDRERNFQSLDSLLKETCRDCHSGPKPEGGFSVESLRLSQKGIEDNTFRQEPWEKIVRKLRAGQMPPPGAERPNPTLLENARKAIEEGLDLAQQLRPFAGKTDGLRRLNRTEYQNSIRDLLSLNIDAQGLLPKDESSHGFDNITVGELSPTLLNRYISAAQTISRIAIGGEGLGPMGTTIRLPPDRTQEEHLEGLPFGTRGGVLIEHTFPRDGEYEIQLRLSRDRDEKIEGLTQTHEIDIFVDRERKSRLTVDRPMNDDFSLVGSNLKKRISITAGKHSLGVTFPQKGSSLSEINRQPFDASYNRHRHPRPNPAIYEVSIVGPFESKTPGESLSRKKIFQDVDIRKLPNDRLAQLEAAKTILGRLARMAYRRPLVEEDLKGPIRFFEETLPKQGFEAGIEAAITSILVNPHFLFRVETSPEESPQSGPHPISDLELASRLSFFLWSSIPDERLLGLAEANELHKEEVLKGELVRMLQDDRSHSLVTNFASQWLYLRNLDSITPDLRLYPDFDDNLRHAFRSETELLVEDIFRNDKSLLSLIQSDYTYLNHRLAKHYGIPNVLGSHFRKVEVTNASHRGGILRHGSILAVTSYATRTSPTIRGNWILQNIIGTPPPPPPPNVPALKDKEKAKADSLRERLAAHRSDAACASCHNLMDPIGFSLDRFDALGRWRELEEGRPMDTSGILPDGTEIQDVVGLEENILKRPGLFVGTMAEKLLVFALGRGIDHRDGPELRKIVRLASEKDYRFSSLIEAIVLSKPFLMRDSK